MLVLSRKVGEEICIGDGITVIVNRVSGNRVTLGIKAPDDVKIVRGELEPIVRSFDKPSTKRRRTRVAPASLELDTTLSYVTRATH